MPLIDSGVHVAIAAGSSYRADACNASPARVLRALTAGASQRDDFIAYFSNVGGCVDVYAPGYSTRAAINTGDASYGFVSGTSFASPHVAGVIAQYLALH